MPKKVAGLKVPKALRKSGVLETLVGSRAGREILADALVAAATAAAAALVKDRGERHGTRDEDGRRRSRPHSIMSDATQAAAGAIAGFVTDAAQNLIAGSDPAESKPKAAKAAPRRRQPKPKTKAEPAGEAAGPADGG
ncbi:hypothetical protein [Enterovirga aerilata]|uniref:Uncharacterized protein n=1 Tax=Enterovirga aerilata TaxID=2730920 RepID=A0A849HXE2_9HYPH|nr:hypothetical protein [Enterovirga sp. DB1703]